MSIQSATVTGSTGPTGPTGPTQGLFSGYTGPLGKTSVFSNNSNPSFSFNSFNGEPVTIPNNKTTVTNPIPFPLSNVTNVISTSLKPNVNATKFTMPNQKKTIYSVDKDNIKTKEMMDIICKNKFYFANNYETDFKTFFQRENRYMLQVCLIDNESLKYSTSKDYTATDNLYEVFKNSNYLLGSKVISVLEINNQHVVTFLSYLQQSVIILPKTTFPFDLKSVKQNLIVCLIEVPQPIHKQIIKKIEYKLGKQIQEQQEQQGQQGQQLTKEEENKRDFDFLINCLVNLILSMLILSNPAELFLGHLDFYLNNVTYYSDSNNKSEVSPFKLVVSGDVKGVPVKGDGEKTMGNTDQTESTIEKMEKRISEICEKIRTNGYKSLFPTDVKFLLQYLFEYNILNNNTFCLLWIERVLLPNVVNPETLALYKNLKRLENLKNYNSSKSVKSLPQIVESLSLLVISKTIHDQGCSSLFVIVTDKIMGIMKDKIWTKSENSVGIIKIDYDLIKKFCVDQTQANKNVLNTNFGSNISNGPNNLSTKNTTFFPPYTISGLKRDGDGGISSGTSASTSSGRSSGTSSGTSATNQSSYKPSSGTSAISGSNNSSNKSSYNTSSASNSNQPNYVTYNNYTSNNENMEITETDSDRIAREAREEEERKAREEEERKAREEEEQIKRKNDFIKRNEERKLEIANWNKEYQDSLAAKEKEDAEAARIAKEKEDAARIAKEKADAATLKRRQESARRIALANREKEAKDSAAMHKKFEEDAAARLAREEADRLAREEAAQVEAARLAREEDARKKGLLKDRDELNDTNAPDTKKLRRNGPNDPVGGKPKTRKHTVSSSKKQSRTNK